MTVHSYLEYVLTILGWLINNGILDTITATGLFALPLLFRLFSLWLKARKQSSNKGEFLPSSPQRQCGQHPTYPRNKLAVISG
ncbi:TPA: hypothetical protein N2F43_002716 [Salmonella enterica]|nr:hypothetical protein [Salmonella enterica]